eukprot:10998639-Alexandrium_andersonii.AAC.1
MSGRGARLAPSGHPAPPSTEAQSAASSAQASAGGACVSAVRWGSTPAAAAARLRAPATCGRRPARAPRE